MADLISLKLSEVLDLQPFLMAGCMLSTDERRLYAFQTVPDLPFVVVGIGVETQYFPSIIDAWCAFTDREHQCPQCDGGWIDARAVTLVEAFVPNAAARHATMKRQCGLCGGFGKLTDEQLVIVASARRLAQDFDEDHWQGVK